MDKKSKKINKTFLSTITPWMDLPQQIQAIIRKQPDLLHNISYGGVKKSWKTVPKAKPCNLVQKETLPQLQSTIDHEAKRTNVIDTKMHTGFEWYYKPCGDRYCTRNPFVEYTQGVPGCYVWDPLASSVTLLPRWYNNIPFKHGVLTPFPKNYPNCHRKYRFRRLMVVTGISHPAFMNISLKVLKYSCSRMWHPINCTILDPHSLTQQYMQFTNVIAFEDKFYALSLQGTLVVIERMSWSLEVLDVSSSRAVPSVPSMNFKEYLIQLNGEILLVFLISTRMADVIDEIEIYRLSIPTLKWIRVENLGDIALFIGGNCCMHVSASKVRCKGNCVYFTKGEDCGLSVYDIAKGNFTPSYNTHQYISFKS